MDEEEFPPWDWRRNQQLEVAFGRAEQLNVTSRADLSTARQQIQSVQNLLGEVDVSLQSIASVLGTAMSKVQTLELDRTALQGRMQSIEARLNVLENPPLSPDPPPPPAAPAGEVKPNGQE